MQAVEPSAPQPALLRQDQVEEMEGEREALQRKLANPNIQDKGMVHDQLRALERQLESQRPRPYLPSEVDNAVKREAELRSQWLDGMLSHEEMRKCPPGAADRHLEWERKNKRAITEWQNIMRRLNAGSDARDIASIERFRPKVSTMNMDGAQIPGKQFFLPPEGAAMPVMFSTEQLALLRALNPSLADQLATLTNVQRQQVKEALTAPEKTKRTMSPEQKEKMRAGREAAKARKAA